MKRFSSEIKLLVVDDEPDICKAVTRYLGFQEEFQKLRIFTAGNFEEALRIIDEENPLIILQDINLPDGNGLNLIKQVKRVHPIIQFIVITGASNLDRVIDAVAFGAVDYLRKPMDMERLKEVVEHAMIRCNYWGELFRDEYLTEQESYEKQE